MSDSRQDNNDPTQSAELTADSSHTDSELIVPIDFTPTSGTQARKSFKLSPARLVISALLLCFAAIAWFILSAKSIFIDVTPPLSEVTVNSPMAIKIGPRYLVRQGTLPVSINAEGYYDLATTLDISTSQAQTFVIELIRLPGFLNLATQKLEGAEITIDDKIIGTTPLTKIELAAGPHSLLIQKERYEPYQANIDIEGMSIEQSLDIELLPAWAKVDFSTHPIGATVSIDGKEIGLTPLSTEVLAGEHQLLLKLSAHKAWTEELVVIAREDQNLPLVELTAADGLVLLQSTPSNASITLDGAYQGQSPLEISVPPGANHEVVFFLNGYDELRRDIQTKPDQELSVNVTLKPIVTAIEIATQPANAQLYIDGEFMGSANQTLELLATTQLIEIHLEGYVSYSSEFTPRPGLAQKLNVTLKSLEQQRIDAIKPQITTATGQTLKLLYPGEFVMGASRREAGRQANEVLRKVSLTRPFYLSLTEVSNAQFASFDPEHTSGIIGKRTLNNNNQPVVQISWEQAALYCNWLSEQESLPLFYKVANGSVTGFEPDSPGYRLPTEAEWAWVARVDNDPDSLIKFPWGAQLPPPENHGNYADISAASILGKIIQNYDDSFLGTSPVASFEPNSNGFYDIGGNVAEWVHDYYGTSSGLSSNQESNPYGPNNGSYHVVRGSSWAHGNITQLRLSYRDYSNEARDDIGFRVARTLQP